MALLYPSTLVLELSYVVLLLSCVALRYPSSLAHELSYLALLYSSSLAPELSYVALLLSCMALRYPSSLAPELSYVALLLSCVALRYPSSLCDSPNPGPTRLADPNRVRSARLRTGTFYLIFFFFLKANWHLWVWPTSYNRIKILYTNQKNYHRSGVHQNLYTYN